MKAGYRLVLEREAEPAGLKFWNDFLQSHAVKEFIRALGYSEEYKNRFISN